MARLTVKDFVFTAPGLQNVLKTTAKRYRPEPTSEALGIILLFVHGTGFHKEQWEATIETLLNRYAAACPISQTTVREAWAFDWQDHGQAAILNKEVISGRDGQGPTLQELAATIAAFLKSEHVKDHAIVCVAHSVGSAAALFSTTYFPPQNLPYHSIILIEPTMITKELWGVNIGNCQDTLHFLTKAASKRRSSWPSKQAALSWLGARPPWRDWDPQVLQAFVDHALEQTTDCVRLKCDPTHEATHYCSFVDLFEPPQIIKQICHAVPIHFIWGEVLDIIPVELRNALSDSAIGFEATSIQFIRGSGHVIPAQQPKLLAQAICRILDTTMFATNMQTKL